MVSPFDTIVAPITPPGHGAVALVRVSGPEAWRVASEVFLNWPREPRSHHAVYGGYEHGDEGLALPFSQGRGYTGEEAVEFSVHGSPVSVRALIESCLRAGARPASPGEFTLRAFVNGRIDLAMAEGVRDTVEAQTRAQLAAASRLRHGMLSGWLSGPMDRLTDLLVALEANVDFCEETGPVDRVAMATELRALEPDIASLLDTAWTGRVMHEGLTIAVCGLPNAGKSSLWNALLRQDRAIVTDIPGTTRDTLEELADVGGVPCRLIDTAGLRHTDDPIEAIGVQRAQAAIASADWVWYLYDQGVGWTPEDETAFAQLPPNSLLIAAKADVRPAKGDRGWFVSVRNQVGLRELELQTQTFAEVNPHVSGALISARHAPLLEQARDGIRLAIEALDSTLPPDLAATGMRAALSALGEITGATASVEVLDRLFEDFCVGK